MFLTVFLARFISAVLCYPVVAFFEMIFLCYIYGVDVAVTVLGIILHAIGPIIAPVLYGWVVSRGDFFVSNRADRPLLFIPGILSYLFAACLFHSLNFISISVLELASMMSSIILLVVSFYWKVSVHMASITIPIIFFPMIGFMQVLLFFPLLLVVGWARVKVEAHTFQQVLGGFAVGLISTVLTVYPLKLISYIA